MKKRQLLLGLLAVLLLAPTLAGAKVVTLNIPQLWQHKDTVMPCVAVPNPCGPVVHAANHAAAACRHCGYYCVPACIAMISLYRGGGGNKVLQDWIYDNGKLSGGEIPGDGILQTHGVGMFDRSALASGLPDEVVTAFQWTRGLALIYIWGPVNQGFLPLTPAYIIQCLDDNIPIIWCDHFGWPDGIYPPPVDEIAECSGHAKIIAGYNDQGTAATGDDRYFIFDPWPVSGSPYWIGQQPLLDPRDVFYADFDPVPDEQITWGVVKELFR